MSEKIGLMESVSLAVGGMVGGGIFAVLGVVAATAGTLAWLAFVASGLIAFCAGYSFVRLNSLLDDHAGPITYVAHFTGNTKLAGMTGWTFIIGYVGTMSLYAYAFGGYFVELVSLKAVPAVGLPLRPVVTLAAVVVFVGLNVLGARSSGRTEDVLVGLKVLILLVFGVGGLYYGYSTGKLTVGLSNVGFGPLIASAIAFVAFEGWELLAFDQDSIRDPEETVRKAIYISIGFATFLYIVVAVVTTNLVDAQTIQQNAETSLAIAARPFLGSAGFLLISVAALFSTGSALNATLFSAARLSKKLVSNDFLPCELTSEGDEPVRPLLVLGVLTAGLSVLGSLNAISSFASLAFITLFGAMSFLAFRHRGGALPTTVIPAIGALGAAATIVALIYHLATTEPDVFGTVLVLVVAVIGIELLYFEREPILAEITDVERTFEQ
ncbi:APC family permease [Halobium palmae]|uniref:APC family permease n=1 Tax=Halobium palmae TaxID=1776492 RepID=A0ABD5RUB1_9EURY